MRIVMDFPLILTTLVLLSGAIFLLDVLFFSKKRNSGKLLSLCLEKLVTRYDT